MKHGAIFDNDGSAYQKFNTMINWNDYDFYAPGLCPEDMTPFQFVELTKPDLVFVDASYPEPLELINEIRSAENHTEIVLITETEDFAFAQKALKHGILSLVLEKDFAEALPGILEEANQKISSHKAIKRLLDNSVNYESAQFLQTLLSAPKLNENHFEKLCEAHNIALPKGNYLIALVHIDASQNANYDFYHLTLVDVINKIMSNSSHYILANLLSTKNIPLLIYEKEENGIVGILSLLNDIRDEFKKRTAVGLTIGISLFFRQITAITRALEQARWALEDIPHYGRDCIIDYSYAKNEPTDKLQPFTQREIYTFCNMVRKFDTAGTTTFIKNYFDKITTGKNTNIDQLKANILELAVYVLKESVHNTTILSDVLGRNISPASELSELEYMSDIYDWIIDLVSALTSHPELVLSNDYSNIVRNAMVYTMTNYNEQLTAASIAQHLYVSSNHFMRVFKKEVGVTFGEYLAEYRIKIAKLLLKTNEYKIYEVAQMVGYSNVKYFNKIFKKYTGHVPTYFQSTEE